MRTWERGTGEKVSDSLHPHNSQLTTHHAHLLVQRSKLKGSVDIPGSKSHTIRGVFFASLAEGVSTLEQPLDSFDTQAAVDTCRAFGAEITTGPAWTVRGFGGEPEVPADVVDVRNSGSTVNFALSVAALAEGHTVFTGDEQIRRRPCGPLLDALIALGATVMLRKGAARRTLPLEAFFIDYGSFATFGANVTDFHLRRRRFSMASVTVYFYFFNCDAVFLIQVTI